MEVTQQTVDERSGNKVVCVQFANAVIFGPVQCLWEKNCKFIVNFVLKL